MSGRGSYNNEARGGFQGYQGQNMVFNPETGQYEHNPGKFRRLCRSRAADRKLKDWETTDAGSETLHQAST